MIELYLNNERVFTDTSQTVKVTKENPYFTQSGSYTLDVNIPMDILENRRFFKNIQSLPVTKKTEKMDANLIVDNHLLLSGSAVINSISDTTVKVQLLGGNSDVNFIANNGDVYIDDIDYGEITIHDGKGYTFNGERGGVPVKGYTYIYGKWDAYTKPAMGDVSEYVVMPVYDETKAEIKNVTRMHVGTSSSADTDKPGVYTHGDTIMPNLLLIVKKVIEYFGYRLISNDVDVVPWNRLVICNARKTLIIQEALPHWTVTDFLTEIQNFFNCTFVFNESDKTAELISNLRYFDAGVQQFEALDEYTSDVSDEDEEKTKSLGSSNIRFDMSDSDTHYYDAIDEDLLSSYERKKYSSYEELLQAFNALSDEDKKKYLFVCPEGTYCFRTNSTQDVPTDSEGEGIFGGSGSGSSTSDDDIWFLGQVNQFGPLIRNEKVDEYIDLRICPVGITVEQKCEYYTDDSSGTTGHGGKWIKQWDTEVQMPSLKNEKGDIPSRDYTKVVWAGITGSQDANSETTAEDRIQVMFVGTQLQYVNKPGYKDQSKKIPYPMGFTDFLDKAINLEDCGYQNIHDSWSLALSNSPAEHYLGQLHANGYLINTQTEIQISFESQSIPDIRKIFMFKNKRYVCEKMEINVANTGIDKLIKGYFFEML
nr:MAG TPA: hypothetical protein [Caudoviricetes sp.]